MLAQAGERRTCLWVRHGEQEREAGVLYSVGLMELAIDPARLILLAARDVPSVLQAALDEPDARDLGR